MEVPLLKQWLPKIAEDRPELYLVGGAVRDLLMGKRPPKDVDVACRGAKELAEKLAQALHLALVPMEKKPEEPCYRVVDRKDSDRFLDIAELRGETIVDDLRRRDFTINAVAVGLTHEGVLTEIIDPTGGVEDIRKKTIRAAGEGNLCADPLRVLRAVRFSAQLDFTIEPATLRDMQRCAPLLRNVASERILVELILILQAPHGAPFFRRMDDLGILDVILPEIAPMRACTQDGFHHLDVWHHSLLVMEHCERIQNDPGAIFGEVGGAVAGNLEKDRRGAILKLSALLHDIGKPKTRAYNPRKGRITFYRHEKEGATTAEAVAKRLTMSKRDRDFLKLLVLEHRHVRDLSRTGVKPSTVVNWFRRVGDDAPPAIILSMADSEAKLGTASTDRSRKKHWSWSVEAVRIYYTRLKPTLATPNLVNGDDLKALGAAQGPTLGRILQTVREAQDLGEVRTREDALKLARKLIASTRVT